jgi:hypothetical protein
VPLESALVVEEQLVYWTKECEAAHRANIRLE